jgi:hypothetical protein
MHMKKKTIQAMALAITLLIAGVAGAGPLFANSINGSTPGSSTTTVRVAHHYEFRNGQYVWVPTYYGQAPNSKSPFTRPHWMSPGYVRGQAGYRSEGHWSTQVQ